MDVKTYQKLKGRIEKIVSVAEDEFLKKGENISSVEFQEFIDELKRKTLEERKISLEEYEAMEAILDKKKQIEVEKLITFIGKKFTELEEKAKIFFNEKKNEFQQRVEEIADNFNKEIKDLDSFFKKEIDATRKAKTTKDDVVKIVKGLIPVIPKHSDSDHIKILKDLTILGNKIEGNRDKLFKKISHGELIDIKPDQHHFEGHILESHLTSVWRNQFGQLVSGRNADNLHKHKFPEQRIWGGAGVSYGGGGGTWGQIVGTLSNQTDLQTALTTIQIVNKTDDYLVMADDNVITCDATGDSFTITLPPAAGAEGKMYTIKKVDSSVNTITIDANAAETIDGDLTKVITTQYVSITIISDGSNWLIT